MTSHNETLINFAKPKRIQQSCMTCVCSILEGRKEKCMSKIEFIMTKKIIRNNWTNLSELYMRVRILQSFRTFIASLKIIKKSEQNFKTNLGLAKLNSNDQFFHWHLTCSSKGSQYKPFIKYKKFNMLE